MVDELVNTSINARRMANVEQCFGLTGQPLSIPGRVLIGEGRLAKMCRKKLKRRQFFLFNDLLVYGNIIIENKKYNKQHIIPLENIKLENLEEDVVNSPNKRHGFLICTPRKSFAVYAATAEEKRAWMGHMKRCIHELLNKGGKTPSLQHAAVWVPDQEAAVCMVCKKAQFNLVNRRHHCRKCGSVVCAGCSSRSLRLPMSSKPQRVCDLCFDAHTRPVARIDHNIDNGNNVDNVNQDNDVMNDVGEKSSGRPERPPPPQKPPRAPMLEHRAASGDSFWWDSVDTALTLDYKVNYDQSNSPINDNYGDENGKRSRFESRSLSLDVYEDKSSDSSSESDEEEEVLQSGSNPLYDESELISPLSQLGPLPRSSDKKPAQNSNL